MPGHSLGNVSYTSTHRSLMFPRQHRNESDFPSSHVVSRKAVTRIVPRHRMHLLIVRQVYVLSVVAVAEVISSYVLYSKSKRDKQDLTQRTELPENDAHNNQCSGRHICGKRASDANRGRRVRMRVVEAAREIE